MKIVPLIGKQEKPTWEMSAILTCCFSFFSFITNVPFNPVPTSPLLTIFYPWIYTYPWKPNQIPMVARTRPGALSLAELGTMIPKSGCEYAYLYEAFGPIPAFLFSWVSMILLKPSSVAIIALTCAEYVMVPLFDDGCGVPPVLNRKLTAAVVICEYFTRHIDLINIYEYLQ